MKKFPQVYPSFLFFLIFIIACASQRPVLYPNQKLEEAGQDTAQKDVDLCIEMAEEAGVSSSSKGGEVAGQTAKGAVIGTATGAAVGAVTGRPGRGAAIGAAGGGAAGFMRGLFRSNKPDPIFRRFVNRCLKEKGYEPIGWD